MTTTPPIPTIEVLASGPAEGGGIGRFMSYLLRANQDLNLLDIKATVDPRGPKHWISSLWRTPLSVMQLFWLRIRHGARPVVHVHIAGRMSTVRKLVVMAAAQALGYRVVVHYHEYGYTKFFKGLSPLAQSIVRFVLKRCHGHIVLGQIEARALPEVINAEPDRFSVIHTCAPRELTEISPQRPTSPIGIVFVGALGQRKGVDELIAAMARLPRDTMPDWRLTFCGGGDVRSRQEAAAEFGIADSCVFLGHVDEATVRAQLAANHIFCLPSHAEGLSVALLESMAMSCAAVATPVGEQGSILRHEVNALVVQPGDVAGLSQALERLITDETLRTRLAENARQSVLNGFTSDYTLREVSAALLKASQT